MSGADWAALAGVLAPVLIGVFAAVRWDARNMLQEALRALASEAASAEKLAESTFAGREQVARLEERIRELGQKIDEMRVDCRACRSRSGGE